MRLIVWFFRALVFFTLFAFALNNQQSTTVNWFFGAQWHAPLVIVVLVAFAGGCAIGVIAMVPAWWHHRRVARKHAPVPAPAASPAGPPSSMLPSEFGPEHPPRENL
jgi:lipopolysaccharide assembly protein A